MNGTQPPDLGDSGGPPVRRQVAAPCGPGSGVLADPFSGRPESHHYSVLRFNRDRDIAQFRYRNQLFCPETCIFKSIFHFLVRDLYDQFLLWIEF